MIIRHFSDTEIWRDDRIGHCSMTGKSLLAYKWRSPSIPPPLLQLQRPPAAFAAIPPTSTFPPLMRWTPKTTPQQLQPPPSMFDHRSPFCLFEFLFICLKFSWSSYCLSLCHSLWVFMCFSLSVLSYCSSPIEVLKQTRVYTNVSIWNKLLRTPTPLVLPFCFTLVYRLFTACAL